MSDDENKTAELVPLDDNEPEFLQDIHAIDMVDSGYEEAASTRPLETSRPGRLAPYNFSETTWSDG